MLALVGTVGVNSIRVAKRAEFIHQGLEKGVQVLVLCWTRDDEGGDDVLLLMPYFRGQVEVEKDNRAG